MIRNIILSGCLLLAAFLAACATPTPAPVLSPTMIPSSTPSVNPSPSPQANPAAVTSGEEATQPPVPTATRPAAAQPATQDQPVSAGGPGSGAGEIVIYSDQLGADWQDWSWDTDRNLDNGQPVQSGSRSIAITYTAGWGGFYLHPNTAVDLSDYQELRFYIHGGTEGNQKISVIFNKSEKSAFPVTAVANSWTLITIPLRNVGSPSVLTDLFLQDATGNAQKTFYLDQISFVSHGPAPTMSPVPGGVALNIDAAANRRAISPYIYGMNFASSALITELRLPVVRWGGNAVTRYNWKNDTSNRASDWFFENIPNDNSNPGKLPDDSSSDQFIEQNKQLGAETLLTIPMIGWTPKDRTITCAFSVQKYGKQQRTDPSRSDCGNGLREDGSAIPGNDPKDTSTAIDPAFVQDWMRHLIGLYGTADKGGVKFYNLDNEPALWNATHRDVHPKPVSYDELRDRTYQYAAAVKAVDPAAQTLGPVEWGWSNYFYSALDSAQKGDWWKLPADRLLHGNKPLVEWYLQQMKAYEEKNGVRILDYLDLHIYSQVSGVSLTSNVDAGTQALRLRSTRALWDPSYVDESWINEPINLIPRMRDWVNNNYPGTKIALSEYNWGALDHINGALAQADILGIFGREGLDLATLWAPPEADQPGAYAFRMYRNYDGKGGAFGDTSVQAASNLPDTLSVYAATRSSDGALTLIVINKTKGAQTGAFSIANFSHAANAQAYRYSQANLKAIVRLDDLAISGNSLNVSLEPYSITLIVLPKN